MPAWAPFSPWMPRIDRWFACPALHPLFSAAELNGEYVANTPAETTGSLFMHFIRGEEVRHSFGASDATGPYDVFRSLRIVAARPDGIIATARRVDYTVEMWDSSGSRLAELHHEARLNEVEVRQVPYNLTDHHRGLHGRRTDA